MKGYLAVALISYLCGSIPFGYILVRIFKGQDVRQSGSGNIGATNVARTAPALGIATLLLDSAKGAAAILMLPFISRVIFPLALYGRRFGTTFALAAVFVVLGHMFPVWLHFRGGKGVATALGVYLAFPVDNYEALLCAFIIFVVVLALTRYVSLASMVSAIAFPAILFKILPGWYPRGFVISAIAISVLIILKHHSNIRRLLNGSESRFGRKRPVEALASED